MTVAHVNDTSPAFKQISTWLESATRVVVLTGAGISTASGIPDFRGPEGLWKRDPAAEKLSDIRYYVNDPAIRRKAWLARRDSPVWQASPGAGHYALVRFEQSGRLHTLVTQNIDGLHQLAGSADERVIEIHGTLRQVACLQCSYRVADVITNIREFFRVRVARPQPLRSTKIRNTRGRRDTGTGQYHHSCDTFQPGTYLLERRGCIVNVGHSHRRRFIKTQN